MIALNILSFLLIILGFSSLAFVIIFINKTSTERLLLEQQKQAELEILYQKKMIESTVKVQEAERKRFSGDLHDNLISRLNIVMLSLEANNKAVQELQESIHLARRISHNLSPPFIDSIPIHALLQNYLLKLNSMYKIEFHINIIALPPIPIFYKLQLYRIFQEAISNIVKHSQATELRCYMRFTSRFIEIIIADNGVGFEFDTVKKGLGLDNILLRVQLLKGQIKFKSVIDKGSRMILVLYPELIQEYNGE